MVRTTSKAQKRIRVEKQETAKEEKSDAILLLEQARKTLADVEKQVRKELAQKAATQFLKSWKQLYLPDTRLIKLLLLEL